MRKITVNLLDEQGANTRSYNYCVGGGRAYETLLAENQRHLKIVKDLCGFRYLRFHGLFHDDMAVYHEDVNGNPYYNWQYIDLLYDAMLDIGIRPFVELSFMPSKLASGSQTIFFWRGNVTMPKSLDKWAGLVKAFCRHLLERYGEQEVEKWYFEVWNEPNLNIFFASDVPFDDYMKLYSATAQAIKHVDPKLRVGGPATASCEWIESFINACAKNYLPLDFITTHAYGVEAVDGAVDEFGNNLQVLIKDEDSVSKEMRKVRETIKNSCMPNLELYFTEWSSSFSPRDNCHDSYHEAAYVVNRVKNAFQSVDAMSYWTFSDIFEEAGPPPAPFHGGFGLLNTKGVKKPAFFAFQYLNQLGDTLLKCSDPKTLCAKSDDGVQVLFWDYTLPEQNCSNQEYFTNDLPPKPADEASIEISNLIPAKYELQLYGVGYRMNDAYTLYRELNVNRTLTRSQEEYIKSCCDGAPIISKIITVGADGRFTFTRGLRQNDVYLLTLKRIR